MIKITFPDLSVKEFESGITAEKIAETISSSLAKKCIIAKVNDELYDMSRPIEVDAKLDSVTDRKINILYEADLKYAFDWVKENYTYTY